MTTHRKITHADHAYVDDGDDVVTETAPKGLPQVFVDAFRALEIQRHARPPLFPPSSWTCMACGHNRAHTKPTNPGVPQPDGVEWRCVRCSVRERPADYAAREPVPHAMLIPEIALHHPLTGWWLVVLVRRPTAHEGRSWAILGRPFTDADLVRAAGELYGLVYGPETPGKKR